MMPAYFTMPDGGSYCWTVPFAGASAAGTFPAMYAAAPNPLVQPPASPGTTPMLFCVGLPMELSNEGATGPVVFPPGAMGVLPPAEAIAGFHTCDVRGCVNLCKHRFCFWHMDDEDQERMLRMAASTGGLIPRAQRKLQARNKREKKKRREKKKKIKRKR